MRQRRMQQGFSLVEMSIVILIIGLITGGILVGQDLIRTAEVQSLVSELQKYQAATGRFQAQFASLPGDMPDAADHWATAVNGDGDSFIDPVVQTGGTASEPFQFWLHLRLADEIDSDVSGVNGPTASIDIIADTNVPTSRLEHGAWVVGYDAATVVAGAPPVAAGNFMMLTRDTTGGAGFPAPVLTPTEASMIDTKIDDGFGLSGDVVGAPTGSCVDGTNYIGTDDTKQCALVFLNAF